MSRNRSSRRWLRSATKAIGTCVDSLESRRLLSVTLNTVTEFDGSDGFGPSGVILSNGTLYGVASGGAKDDGLVFSVPATGGTPKVLAEFNGSNGAFPNPGLTISGNMLYGTTVAGGYGYTDGFPGSGNGVVFAVPITGGAPKVLATFNNNNGPHPGSGLTLSGNTLYGSGNGGVFPNVDGTIFSVPITGGTPTVLGGFSDSLFSVDPKGLTLWNNTLYGTTGSGGLLNDGMVFSIPVTGGTPTILGNFDGNNIGSDPGSLTISGGMLYGTTNAGGPDDDGVVFSLPVTGGTPNVLGKFNGANGKNPGNLILLGNMLYGTTQTEGDGNGGSQGSGQGTFFSIPVTGGAPRVLAEFDGSNGADPFGDMVLSGNTLYGTTSSGGASGNGEIFQLTGFSVSSTTITAPANQITTARVLNSVSLGYFESNTAGPYAVDVNWGDGTPDTRFSQPGVGTITPQSHSFSTPGKDNVSVSVTDAGGNKSNLVNFTEMVNSLTLTTVLSFNGTDGSNPSSGLIEDKSGNLYGETYNGGSGLTGQFTGGTVYEIMAGTNALNTLFNFNQSTFTSPDGTNPSGGLFADSSGNLLGTTQWGGPNGDGTVFQIAAGSQAFSTLVDFDGTDGGGPCAGVIGDASGNLYGTTVTAPSNGYGTVFEIAAGTNMVNTLAALNQSSGTNPQASLFADKAGNLYGTTTNYGAFGGGTVFEITAGTDTFVPLVNFTGVSGEQPIAGLISDVSGNLYGTTEYGGTGLNGTVFKISASTHALTTLANFDGSDGLDPKAGLIIDAAGDLYGTTYNGGSSGDGTVFEIAAGSGNASTLFSFNGSNGAHPTAGLMADAAGNLYGTTSVGGSSNDGTVFEITGSGFVVTQKASIAVTAPAAQAATAGLTSNFSLGAFAQTGAISPYKDTINWGDGSTNTVLEITSAGALPATSHTFAVPGNFTVSESITDSSGSSSDPATFNVVVSPASLPASKLVVAGSPTGTTAGKTLSSVVVDIKNSAGQIVTTDASTVTLGIASGPSGAKIGGTVTAIANKGVATFSNLLLNTAGTYVLKVTDGSLTASNTSSFTIVPAAASKLVFGQAPSTSIAGKAISPAVTVKVEDAFGNLETSDKSTVKLAISTGPGGSGLGGTTSLAASGGVATFSSLQLNVAGTYSLKATDGTLASVSTSTFSVTPAAAAKLVFSTLPSKAVHNTAFAVKVSIEDTFGNLLTTNTTKVEIAIASGPTGGTLSGSTAISALAGVATFSTLKLSKAGSYKFKVTDGALSSAVSASIAVA